MAILDQAVQAQQAPIAGQPPVQQPPVQQPPVQQPPAQGGVPMGPEDPEFLQHQLSKASNNASSFIFNEAHAENLLRMIAEGEGDIAQPIAEATYQLVTSLIESAENAKFPLSKNIMADLGMVIVAQILELAESAGLYESSSEEQDQQVMLEAVALAESMYANNPPPGYEVSPEEGEAIIAAAEQGEFDDTAPPTGILNQAAPGGGQPQVV
jgi:hypothetical protein